MVCAFAGVFVYAVGGGIASAATATNVVDAAYGGLSVTPPTPAWSPSATASGANTAMRWI